MPIAPPLQSLETRTLERFFSRWAKGDTCLGSQAFISRLYESSAPDDALRSAVIAIASADLAVIARHGNHAGQALRLTRHRSVDFAGTLTTAAGPVILLAIGHLRRFWRWTHSRFVEDIEWSNAASLIIRRQILYLRRPAPLGAHTPAILYLMQCKTQVIAQDTRAKILIRATAPRLQARYLLCGEPSLGNAVRSLAQFAEYELDARVAVFIADACGVLHALEGQQHELDDQAWFTATTQMLVKSLRHTLHDMEDWLESHAKETKPKASETTSTISREMAFADDSEYRPSGQPNLGWSRLDSLPNVQAEDSERLHQRLSPGSSQETSEQAEIDLRPSTDFLLNLLPPLIGIVDKQGQLQPLPQLHDTGLLIAQYPLWLIGATQHAPERPKQKLARYFDSLKSSDQSPPKPVEMTQ